MRCFDVATEVLKEADARFQPLFVRNEEKEAEIKGYCDLVDALVVFTNVFSYEVEVNEDTLDVYLRVYWGEDESDKKIAIVIPGVWKHISKERVKQILEGKGV